MKEIVKAIEVVISSLSPAAHDVLTGIGMAFDPAPRCYRTTFFESDLAAAMADNEALFKDWVLVHDRIGHITIKHVEGEPHHHEGSPIKTNRAANRRAAREQQHA